MSRPNIKKRYKIIAGIIVFITMVLFAVPRIARWYIVNHGTELTGRNLAIDRIRFNYFTGTFRIDNLKLYEAKSDSVFMSFKQLIVNLDYLPLLRNEIFVKYITLDDPFTQVLQNGDNFNFSDLMKTDSTAVKTDTLPQKPLKYIINNISISRGYVKYTDQVLNHTISMKNVDLNIPGFTWNSDSTNLGVDFRFVDGGRLFSKLELNQADSTYKINLKLDSLNLDIIEPYAENSMYISALHGYLSNDIMIRGDMRSIMELSIQGMNRVFDFQLLDTLNRTIFSFDDLSIDIDTLLLAVNRLKINSINIKNPFILFELIDTTNNWLALMKPAIGVTSDTVPEISDSAVVQDESSFAFSKIEIENGKIVISDKTLRFPFEYTVDKINMTTVPDARIQDWIDVGISAGLNGTGTLKADFALNPHGTSDLDISMSIDQFRMKDVDSYFRHYFGFPVSSGRMNFASQNKLRANSLTSNNSIFFRKFNLDKKTEDKTEYNIPLRLALGVMSDKDGIIDLKAPVEMKGEDVKVGNLRKIIFHTIGTLFVKAAVSPVNLIADLFKADPESLKEIHLQLTNPSPDKKNMETVDLLADILNKKPGLNIDLIYCADPESSSDSLAHLMAVEDYNRASHGSDLSKTVADSVLSGYLLGKLPDDSLLVRANIKELCINYIGRQKLDARLDSIRNSQTLFIRNYLNHDREIPSERFRIIGTTPDSIKYEEMVPSFRTYFTAGEGN